MNKKIIGTFVASVALLGSSMALADCPASNKNDDGTPCLHSEATMDTRSTTAESSSTSMTTDAKKEEMERAKNADAWQSMVQNGG